MSDVTDKVQDTAEDATDKVKDTANNGTSTLRDQAVSAFSQAAKDILGPAVQQMSTAAATQAASFVRDQGPKLVKEQVLPQVMKATGAESTDDLAKAGIGKAGELISDSGGITGMAGKLMSKIGGGGKGGAQATGYGKGRRMPIQQDMFVGLPVETVYRAWTEYSEWPSYMHRTNGADPDINEEKASLRVTEKLWLFTRPFTAEVSEQRPNEIIRWKSTDGVSHVGTITFHELADRLTLISLNIDVAPKGPFEKIGRGTRFAKRAIRGDLHRFKGWVETRDAETLDEIEGWLGTVEEGEITESHEDFVEAQDQEGDEQEPEPDEPDDEEGLGEGQPDEDDEPEEEPEADADDEEPEEEKPMPKPRKRGGGQRQRSGGRKPRAKAS
jgi:uncharacterized membrane protein